MFRKQNKYLNCYFPSCHTTSKVYVVVVLNLTARNIKNMFSFKALKLNTVNARPEITIKISIT